MQERMMSKKYFIIKYFENWIEMGLGKNFAINDQQIEVRQNLKYSIKFSQFDNWQFCLQFVTNFTVNLSQCYVWY